MNHFLNRLVVILVSISLFSACAVETETVKPPVITEKPKLTEVESLTDRIKKMYSSQSFEQLIALYEERKDEFTSIETLKPVLLAYLAKNRFEDIKKIAEEKLTRIPFADDKEINLIISISLYENGLFEASRRVLVNLYESGYKNDILNMYLAMIYVKRNQPALALTVSGEIEDQIHRNYIQGKIFFNDGSYSKALERFSQVRGYKDVEDYIIYCLYSLGKYDEIWKSYEEQKIKVNSKTIAIIASALIREGNIQKAVELFNSLPEEERRGSFYRNLGLLYDIYFDDKEKAKELYNKYLREVNDEEVRAWLNN